MKKRIKNIYGKIINVFGTPIEPNGIVELDIPTIRSIDIQKATTFTGKKFWEVSKYNEILNLKAQRYIEVLD